MEIATNNGKGIIPLELTFENPNEAPFEHIQEIAVAYYMIIEKMYGLAKADAPLHITRTWKCNFIR